MTCESDRPEERSPIWKSTSFSNERERASPPSRHSTLALPLLSRISLSSTCCRKLRVTGSSTGGGPIIMRERGRGDGRSPAGVSPHSDISIAAYSAATRWPVVPVSRPSRASDERNARFVVSSREVIDSRPTLTFSDGGSTLSTVNSGLGFASSAAGSVAGFASDGPVAGVATGGGTLAGGMGAAAPGAGGVMGRGAGATAGGPAGAAAAGACAAPSRTAFQAIARSIIWTSPAIVSPVTFPV
ncbi:MAG: hypothetical protein AB2L07_20935 [Thermoanaerobaculaceae bacterium]